jgi:uncharacterized protein YhfF
MEAEFATLEAFWQAYLDTLPAGAAQGPMPEASAFGDNPTLADELLALVLSGTKTATCGALWEYEADDEPLTQVGELGIVLDGAGQHACIIEVVDVEIKPFHAVDDQFAFEEGEGDRSLAYWRKAHRRYFTRTLEAIGRTFDESMPLVCERFRLVYPLPPAEG